MGSASSRHNYSVRFGRRMSHVFRVDLHYEVGCKGAKTGSREFKKLKSFAASKNSCLSL